MKSIKFKIFFHNCPSIPETALLLKNLSFFLLSNIMINSLVVEFIIKDCLKYRNLSLLIDFDCFDWLFEVFFGFWCMVLIFTTLLLFLDRLHKNLSLYELSLMKKLLTFWFLRDCLFFLRFSVPSCDIFYFFGFFLYNLLNSFNPHNSYFSLV